MKHEKKKKSEGIWGLRGNLKLKARQYETGVVGFRGGKTEKLQSDVGTN